MGFFVFFCIFMLVIFIINRSLPDSVKKNATYDNHLHRDLDDGCPIFDPTMSTGSGDNIYDSFK